jgi:prevent-host-death family protein
MVQRRMTKRISAMTARKNLGELLESVYYRGDEIIVERAGKPMGVLIPLSEYKKIERQRAEALAKLEGVWARMPQSEDTGAAEEEIREETEKVRHSTV